MSDSTKSQQQKMKFECCSHHDTSEVLKCTSCKKRYHFSCINATNTSFKELSNDLIKIWLCPKCNRPVPGKDNSNTPVRAIPIVDKHESITNITTRNKQKSSQLSEFENNELTLSDVRKVVRGELKALLDEIKTNIMSQFGTRLKEISEQLSQVTDSINFMEHQHEDIRKEMQLKIDNIKTLESENKLLREDLNEINNRLTQMEQHSRANNIEIQCLPEQKNENLLTVVKQIANTVKYDLKESDIHLCTRTAKSQKNNQRPRSVIVKFSCPRVRDEVLASVINFNKKALPGDKLNSSHAGLGGEHRPIYIAEHLSPAQKSLHAAARLKAKELNYKFVWIKKGFIYMRKNETSEYKFIRNLDSLTMLV